MQYYILIFSAVILFSLMFPVNKKYSIRFGSSAQASLAFSSVCGVVSTLIALFFALTSEGGLQFTWFSFLIAVLVAVFCCIYTFIGFKMMSLGNMSVYTMFLMLGGMLVPYLFGVFLLDEKISAARIIGVIILAISLIFPVIARKKEGRSSVVFLLFCLDKSNFSFAIFSPMVLLYTNP